MGRAKNWIKTKTLQSIIWIAVNLLGAKAIQNQPEPEYQLPCEMCHDHVMIAGIPMHMSQLKSIEDEWVREKIIN